MEPIGTTIDTAAQTSTPSRSSRAERELADYWRQVHRAVSGEIPATLPDDIPPELCPGGCLDSGWVVVRSGPQWEVGHPDFGKAYPCRVCKQPALDQKAIDQVFGAAEFPREYAGFDFATYHALGFRADQDACRAVEDWARAGNGSIFLHGRVGRGKTGLALSALRYRMDTTHVAALYKTTPSLLGKIRDTYNHRPDSPTESQVVDSVIGAGLLLLDDIGTNNPTPHVEEKLYQIVDERKLAIRPTIFTSNMGIDQLGKQLGERIAWRIGQVCSGHIIEVQGENLRAAAA